MFKIKSFIMVGAAVFASLSAINNAYAEKQVWEAADGVYKYSPGNGYASMFVVTDEGVIAIEPVNTKHAKGLLNAIQDVTDKPVRFLLHSHNHWDHSNGGQVFRDAGAKIVQIRILRCQMTSGLAIEKISFLVVKPSSYIIWA